ncbi:MAG: hypothetical protein AB2A00_36700 [Myxococcota bacterium]
MDRFVPLLLTALAVLLRVVAIDDGALSFLAAVLSSACGLTVLGLGVMRTLRVHIPAAAPVMGLATAVVLASVPPLVGLGATAQFLAVVLGFAWAGLSLMDPQAPSGTKGTNPPVTVTRDTAGVLVVGVVSSWLPLMWGGAWSVAGHDVDTLQHQDGPLHAIMTLLVSEGLKPAPGYPLGLHAFMSALSTALGVDVFKAFCVTVVLLVGIAASAATWLATACGASRRHANLAGLLVAVHPLLLFTSMEQFAPQLAAAALVPGALAAALQDDDGTARSALPLGIVMAALLSCYGLAVAVAAPVVVVAMIQRPLVVHGRRLVVAGLVAVVLAPLGVWRLTERFGGSRDVPQNPVKAAQRVKDAPPDPVSVLSPDVDALSENRDPSSALKWNITAAHVVGVSPYRDHFLRSARMFTTTLGRARAEPFRALWWLLGAVLVPGATLLLLILALLAALRLVTSGNVRVGAALLVGLGAGAASVWLGAGSGIKPYYGFKIGTLSLGLIMVGVALGAQWVGEGLGGRWPRWLVLAVLLSRVPPLTAVELEYARGLALDRDFTRVMGPAMTSSRSKRARAADGSPTRRYWESRFVFARANEISSGEDAQVLLCARGHECALEDVGRVVARSGSYTVWAAR